MICAQITSYLLMKYFLVSDPGTVSVCLFCSVESGKLEHSELVRPGMGVEVGDLDLNLCVLEFQKWR
jgi:hypothetical protein